VLGLLATIFFIALNGFFVAAEFALVKVNATQLSTRDKDGDPRVAQAQAVVSRLDRYLSVTQLGITLASLGLGWIGEPAIEHLVKALTGQFIDGEPPKFVRICGVVVAFSVLTFGHVVFGELVPKLLAIQRSEHVALNVALPLRLIYIAFRPLLFILERVTGIVLNSMGLSSDAATEGTLSEDEILGILASNAARTPLGKHKAEFVERVVRFGHRTARNAMVPRVDVSSLPIDTSGALAEETLRSLHYSRLILTKGKSLDEIAGYLYAKDYFLQAEPHKLTTLERLKRNVLFVPEAQGLMEVLRSMQREQTPIAVVVDEYGGTSGIVTMEDILEEIVGEIRDEFDEDVAAIAPVQNEPREFDVDARVNMEELRTIGVAVSEDDGAEPIGAILQSRLGRLPRRGDRVELEDGSIAVVTALAKRRVVSVRVRVYAKESTPPQEEREARREKTSVAPADRKRSDRP
jgi:CBS domain containing-hemolysin-like protein